MLQKIKKMMKGIWSSESDLIISHCTLHTFIRKNQDAFIYAAGRNGDSFRPERGR